MPPSRSLLKQRQVVALVCTVFDRCTEVELPEGERRRRLLLHELYDLRHVVSAFAISRGEEDLVNEPVYWVRREPNSGKYFLAYDNFVYPREMRRYVTRHSLKRVRALYQDQDDDVRWG